jgi:hypothetical protein
MPSRSLRLALACVVFSACSKPDPLYCDENTPCTDEARPFCDLAGEYPASDGIKRTCIPDPFPDADAGPDTFCVANEFVECSDLDTAVYCNDAGSEHISLDCGGPCDAAQDGCQCEANLSTCADNLTIHCGASGRPAEIESCALGCADTGDRCVDVDPSNDLAAYLDMTDDAPVVVLTDGAVIDTDAGTIEDGNGTEIDVPDFQVPAPTNGVAIRVFAVKSLTIGDATVLGERALAIVSDGDVFIRGHVRLVAGAMPDSGCALGDADECTAGPSAPIICAGGAGGGFGSRGGDGGDATGTTDDITAEGGTGGAQAGSETLEPLRGGCTGGESQTTGDFGGPGGSIQVVSRTLIQVQDAGATSFLDANGTGSAGIGGGGSGGGVLLEAPRVVVESGTGMVANGGGGGCSDDAGDPGRLSTAVAPGGTCPDAALGDGGNGGARATPNPEDGQSVARTTGGLGGGGGGGVGRIRVNVPTISDFSEFGAVSPAASIGTLKVR